MLLTLPGIADMYTFSMITWNTLPESYQQREYENTLATVKCQIQQAENPTPADVISTEAAREANAIVPDYFTSKVELEEPEIGSTDPNIQIDINCTDEELHFRMPGGSEHYEDDGHKIDVSDAIPTASWRRRATTELERLNLGTSDVDGYEGNDGDHADANEEEEASQADDGSMLHLEDWGHCIWDWGQSTRVHEDWTVYFRPVKNDHGEANATASNVSAAKTVL